jgi:hypothetical protein
VVKEKEKRVSGRSKEKNAEPSAAAPPKQQEHAAVQVQACQALANLARHNDGMRVKITQSGGIVSVVASMQEHKTSVLLQEKACLTLINLVVNTDNQLKIAVTGGIESVVSAMQAHTASGDVQEYACWALRNLAASPNNKRRGCNDRWHRHYRGCDADTHDKRWRVGAGVLGAVGPHSQP